MSIEATPVPPRPRYLDWVEKNAGPKNYYFPRARRELTRWQKRGPMTRRDWVRFYHWAAKNAIARPEREPEEYEPPPVKGKGGKIIKKKTKKSLDQLMEYISKLCSPRNERSKFQFPPPIKYPYSPKIDWKKPAHHDRGRPFAPPKVPKVFQHIDVETDFWTKLRFPILRSALNYKPSANILKLAVPRIVPPEKEHCPIPVIPEEEPPPRQRMTYRQWREHRRRLEYLAKPVLRPRIDLIID